MRGLRLVQAHVAWCDQAHGSDDRCQTIVPGKGSHAGLVADDDPDKPPGVWLTIRPHSRTQAPGDLADDDGRILVSITMTDAQRIIRDVRQRLRQARDARRPSEPAERPYLDDPWAEPAPARTVQYDRRCEICGGIRWLGEQHDCFAEDGPA